MPPNRSLPPDEFCLGTSPSQAANWRPDRKTLASPTVATSAVAVMNPMPGMVSSRRLMVFFPMPRQEFDLDPADLLAQALDHLNDQKQCPARQVGNPFRFALENRRQITDMSFPLGRNEPVLSHVRAQCADLCRALSDQKMPGPVKHQDTLCVRRFDRNEAHRWTRDRLADGLRIGRVVLVALHIGLDVGRRHQPDFMAQGDKLPCPVMRRRTSLHADHTRRDPFEQHQQLVTTHLAAKHRPAFIVDAVNLENILRNIQTYRGNLHVDGSFLLVGPYHPPWHITMPMEGAVHPITWSGSTRKDGLSCVGVSGETVFWLKRSTWQRAGSAWNPAAAPTIWGGRWKRRGIWSI